MCINSKKNEVHLFMSVFLFFMLISNANSINTSVTQNQAIELREPRNCSTCHTIGNDDFAEICTSIPLA